MNYVIREVIINDVSTNSGGWGKHVKINTQASASSVYQGTLSNGSIVFIITTTSDQGMVRSDANTLDYYSGNFSWLQRADTTSSYNTVTNASGGYFFGTSNYTASTSTKLFYRTTFSGTPIAWESHPFTDTNSHPTLLCKIGSYFFIVGVVAKPRASFGYDYNTIAGYSSSLGSPFNSMYNPRYESSSPQACAMYLAGKNMLCCGLLRDFNDVNSGAYFYTTGSTTPTFFDSTSSLSPYIQIMKQYWHNFYIINNRLAVNNKLYDVSNVLKPTEVLTFDPSTLGGYTGTLFNSSKVCPIGANKALGVFSTYTGSSGSYTCNLYWTFYDGTSWDTPKILKKDIYSPTYGTHPAFLISTTNGAVCLCYYNDYGSYLVSTDKFKTN